MLLKSVPGVLPALKNSDLATTKLWTTHIERITNYQLNAVIAKFKFKMKKVKLIRKLNTRLVRSTTLFITAKSTR